MTKTFCRVCVIVSLVAGTASAQDAAAVLKNAAAAIGAANVRSIRITGSGWNAPVGQGYTPDEDWPRVEVTAYTRVFDYNARAASEQWTRRQGNYPPRGGGGLPIQEWGSAVNGDWRQRFFVNGEYAWNLDGNSTTAAPGPRLSSSAAAAAEHERARAATNIRRLNLTVDRHVGIHGGVSTHDVFMRIARQGSN